MDRFDSWAENKMKYTVGKKQTNIYEGKNLSTACSKLGEI